MRESHAKERGHAETKKATTLTHVITALAAFETYLPPPLAASPHARYQPKTVQTRLGHARSSITHGGYALAIPE